MPGDGAGGCGKRVTSPRRNRSCFALSPLTCSSRERSVSLTWILGRQNPLRLAAIRGQFEIVKYLVEEKHVKPGKDAVRSTWTPSSSFTHIVSV